MPKLPTIINFPKYRTRHLYLKYYDSLKTHLGHFELNLIGLGYTFDCDILRHQISIGDVTAIVIELGGELICLAEFRYNKALFTHYSILEWLERFDVCFQPEHCKENTIQNASHIITGARFRDTTNNCNNCWLYDTKSNELVQLPLPPKIGRVRFSGGGWL